MALGGGIFTTQNKKLPGAYINFVSAQRASVTLSERGVCAVPMDLNWGPDSGVITLSNGDFISNSQKILGYDYTSEYCKPFREIFANAQLAYIYRLNHDTVKASNEYANAKYGGTRGNDIKLVITANVDNPSLFDVKTLLDNIVLDEQNGFSNTSELKSNDFVDFKPGVALQLTAGMPLAGGTNGDGTKASCKYAEAKAPGPDGNNLAIAVKAGTPLTVAEAKKASCKYGEAVTAGAAGNSLSIKIEQGEPYEKTPAVAASCKYARAKAAGAAGNNLTISVTSGEPHQSSPAVAATCKYGTAKQAGAAGNKFKIVVAGSSGAWSIKINDGESDVFSKESYAQDTIVPTELTNDYVEFSAVALAVEDVQLAGGADAVMQDTYTVITKQGQETKDTQENLLDKSALTDNEFVTFLKTEELAVGDVPLTGGADAVQGETYDVTCLNGASVVGTQNGVKVSSELTDNEYITFTKSGPLAVETVSLTGGADAQITPRFTVETKLSGTVVDTQNDLVSSAELQDNQWVTFDKASELVLGEVALENGGENITGASWQNALNALEGYSFNTLGIASNDEKIKQLASAYTTRMRDEVGVKFQTVVFNYGADEEGVINLVNGLDGAPEDPSLIYWVTGAQCACKVYESLTNRTYDGELAPDVSRTQTQLEACVDSGEFVLHRVGDDVRVLTDINSKVTVDDEEGDDFKSNQTIRVLDQIGNDIAALFNDRYLGKVPNDDAGRISFWNEVVKHHQELLRLRAIENFLPEDVTVAAGNDKKSIVVNDAVTPTNALEKLYMSVVVN